MYLLKRIYIQIYYWCRRCVISLCPKEIYKIPRNAFSNLDRFLRSDRQPSEPTTTTTTAEAAAQQDEQQCAHKLTHTNTHTPLYAYACSRAHTERLSNSNKSIKKTMGKGARQLAAAEVGSCCCCGGYWMKCCCCGCKHLTPQAKLKLASHTYTYTRS